MDNASLKGYFKQNVRFSLKAELNPYTTVRFVPGADVQSDICNQNNFFEKQTASSLPMYGP